MNPLSQIQLIGLDLDDTTFNSQKQITPAVEGAIRRAVESGIQVLPATGRQLSSVPRGFLDIPGVRYALTANGAKVYDVWENRVLHEDCLPLAQSLELLAECQRYTALTSVFIDGANYTDMSPGTELAEYVQPEMMEYFRTSRCVVDNLAQTIRELGKPVEKFSIVYRDMADREKAKEEFLARGDCAVTSSIPGNLELNTPTANKGAGLLALGRLLGIPREGVMAVGDSSNDYEMIKAVGFGVAMGNAKPHVKQVADWITTTCDEDGVAVAIDRVLRARGAK